MTPLFLAAILAAALPFHGLPSQFEKIAGDAKGRVGVAVKIVESGETADLHGDERFPMHSTSFPSCTWEWTVVPKLSFAFTPTAIDRTAAVGSPQATRHARMNTSSPPAKLPIRA